MYSCECRLAMAIAIAIVTNDNKELLDLIQEIKDEEILINWEAVVYEFINVQDKVNFVVTESNDTSKFYDYDEVENGQELKGYSEGYSKGYKDASKDALENIKSFLKIFSELHD